MMVGKKMPFSLFSHLVMRNNNDCTKWKESAAEQEVTAVTLTFTHSPSLGGMAGITGASRAV